ncbi:hypothetical protein KC322_g35 [Hortaea werneckii]|nr:hypothetical protein KC322_g35 [Hortaea werneckii]
MCKYSASPYNDKTIAVHYVFRHFRSPSLCQIVLPPEIRLRRRLIQFPCGFHMSSYMLHPRIAELDGTPLCYLNQSCLHCCIFHRTPITPTSTLLRQSCCRRMLIEDERMHAAHDIDRTARS